MATIALSAAIRASSLQAALLHEYDFCGNFLDSKGGPSLVADSPAGMGTLGPASYTFGANQGLSLRNSLPTGSTYSIAIDFSFSTLDGYRKIVDFGNLAGDAGLYEQSRALTFYGNNAPVRPTSSSRTCLHAWS